MIFRFDDICINADMDLVQRMTDFLFERFPDCKVMWGISPLVHRMETGDQIKDQRIFPEIFNAMSDFRNFYKVEKAGIPQIDPRVTRAGHGLVHVDHRLLTKEVQELSVIASCSLVGARNFIPPFNKWNSDTEDVCEANGITLIKFENRWRSMEHNTFSIQKDGKICRRGECKPIDNNKWYLHSREWTFEKFTEWFQNKI
jgi:hypothetical protein